MDNEARICLVEPGELGSSLSDLKHEAVIDLFKRRGALLFRGFDVDLSDFNDFARAYAPSAVFNESKDRNVVDRKNTIQTVNLGSAPFPLHPELSRVPWRPDVAFFHCRGAPSNGGRTTVCDGIELVNALPPDIRGWLVSRSIRYREPISLEALKFWLRADDPTIEQLESPPPSCPFRFEVEGQTIFRSFDAPILYKPPFIDQLAFGNFMLFARYLLGHRNFPVLTDGSMVPDEIADTIKDISDKLTSPVPWRNGDILMVDNARFMHGREAIQDTGERDILTYFGYLAPSEHGGAKKEPFPWRNLAPGQDWRPPGESTDRPATIDDLETPPGSIADRTEKPKPPELTVQNIFLNPDVYLFDIKDPVANFAHMSRQNFHDSIFLDLRIQPVSQDLAPLDLWKLVQISAQADVPRQPTNVIFHIAHCGSTLLARALDQPGTTMVYREPLSLRQLGVEMSNQPSARGLEQKSKAKLRFAMDMLQKRYGKDETTVIKANVPVNLLIREILKDVPGSRGLLLYLPLKSYLVAILKTDGSRAWVQQICREIGPSFCRVLGMKPEALAELTIPQATAFLWFAQMQLFAKALKADPKLKSLDAEMFFAEPAPVLEKLVKHFSISLDGEAVRAISTGDLFSRHAKDPSRTFDNRARQDQRAKLLESLADDIQEGTSWVKKQLRRSPLPKSLPHPLHGKPTPLSV